MGMFSLEDGEDIVYKLFLYADDVDEISAWLELIKATVQLAAVEEKLAAAEEKLAVADEQTKLKSIGQLLVDGHTLPLLQRSSWGSEFAISANHQTASGVDLSIDEALIVQSCLPTPANIYTVPSTITAAASRTGYLSYVNEGDVLQRCQHQT